MSAAIAVTDLSKSYGNTIALDGVTFEATEGSVFALVGPNGSGKSTLIKILMNLLAPTSGHALVEGRDSRQLAAAEFTRIGYVSEDLELSGRLVSIELR